MVSYARIGDPYDSVLAWTTGGSRTGNGNVSFAVPSNGVYWFHVASTLTGETAAGLPIQSRVDDGSPDPITALMDAVAARVTSLNLDGIDADRIFTFNQIDDWYARKLDSACVLIGPVGADRHLPTDGPTNSDAVVYPILVSPADPLPAVADRQSATYRERWFGWRYRITAALTSKGFVLDDDTIKAVTSTVSPGPILSGEWWARNAAASPQVFNFQVWQPRGIV